MSYNQFYNTVHLCNAVSMSYNTAVHVHLYIGQSAGTRGAGWPGARCTGWWCSEAGEWESPPSAPSSSPRTMSTPMRVSVTLARKYAEILQCFQLLIHRGLGWEGCRLVSGRKRESLGVHWSSTRDDEAGESPAHLQPPGRARGHGRGRRRELPAGGAHPGLPHAQRIHSGQGNTGIIRLRY